MSYGNPWGLWLGAVLLPLLVAFLVSRWRRRRVVSSLVLFRPLSRDSATRRLFAAPQHLVALVLTILSACALILAILEPQGASVPPRRFAVVLDTSSSMGTREPFMTDTRFQRALVGLEAMVEALSPEDEMALVELGSEARLLSGWTDNGALVLDLARRLEPRGTVAGSADAIRIADALCQDPDFTEIVLVSDGAGLSIPPHRCPIRYVRIGEDAANLGITGLTARKADALGLTEIYLAVHNASDRDSPVMVDLELDGQLMDVVSETVPAGTTMERLVRRSLPQGEILSSRLRVTGENALADDDTAFAVLRASGQVSVQLVTEYPTTFLAEALALHPEVNLTITSPSSLGGSTEPFDLVVIDSPIEGDPPPADRLMVLDTMPETFGLQTSGRVPEPEIIRWAFDHPLFRFVNLDGVRLSGATAMRLPDGALSLVDMADGPLAFLMEQAGTEVLYLTFHPDSSDLPLRVAFVNLVANIVEWAAPSQAGEVASLVGVSRRLSGAPAGATLEPVAGDPGQARVIPADQPIPAVGVYRLVDVTGNSRALVAANLFSLAETRLDPIRRLGIGARSGWPEFRQTEVFPWWNLVLAALLMMLVEWLLPLVASLFQLVGRRRRRALARRSPAKDADPSRTSVSPRVAPGQ